jgi:hypothetical protein
MRLAMAAVLEKDSEFSHTWTSFENKGKGNAYLLHQRLNLHSLLPINNFLKAKSTK